MSTGSDALRKGTRMFFQPWSQFHSLMDMSSPQLRINGSVG